MTTVNPVNADFDLDPAPYKYPNASEGFLLDEDNALRQHLLGLTVTDDGDRDRPVGVWFSHPDVEIREQKYPYMVITLIDVTEATNRVMSGYYGEQVDAFAFPTDRLPDGAFWVEEELDDTGHVVTEAGFYLLKENGDREEYPLQFMGKPPIPVQIDYQIRIFSRHPRHSRTILADFLGYKVPYRYGALDMGYIDGSARRMQLLDIGHSEAVESNKRLLVSSFTVRVDSFMPSGEITVIQRGRVERIIMVLKGHDPISLHDYVSTRNPTYLSKPDYVEAWESPPSVPQ